MDAKEYNRLKNKIILTDTADKIKEQIIEIISDPLSRNLILEKLFQEEAGTLCEPLDYGIEVLKKYKEYIELHKKEKEFSDE